MKKNHSWPRLLAGWLRQRKSCGCCQGAGGAESGCPAASGQFRTHLDWRQGAPEVNPGRPTLNLVPAGEKARVQDLFLPLPLKKRLLTLGLTNGTEIAVISNESGRMIISVRDSRLGLSPPMARQITYRAKG